MDQIKAEMKTKFTKKFGTCCGSKSNSPNKTQILEKEKGPKITKGE